MCALTNPAWPERPSLEPVTDSPRVHVFENSPGDWWVECLVCEEWVATSLPDRRAAEERFGRHLQNDLHDEATLTALRHLREGG